MSNATGIKHYSDLQVLSSQPDIEDAMQLVRMNALPTGASNDRMFLKVSAGSLAGLDLLWDQPSMSWVEKVKPITVLEHFLATFRVEIASLEDRIEAEAANLSDFRKNEAMQLALTDEEQDRLSALRLLAASPHLLQAAKTLAETSDDPEVVMETNEILRFVEGR